MATKLDWIGIVILRVSRPTCRQLRVTTLIDTSSGQWSVTVSELAVTQLQIPYPLSFSTEYSTDTSPIRATRQTSDHGRLPSSALCSRTPWFDREPRGCHRKSATREARHIGAETLTFDGPAGKTPRLTETMAFGGTCKVRNRIREEFWWGPDRDLF